LVADGFISTVSILCAAHIAYLENADLAASMRDAIFFAHRSTEIGHTLALDACAAILHQSSRPLLDLEMRLGEGSGAALAMPLLRSAAAIMREMATFASAGVSAGEQAIQHSAVEGAR
jgi:nicotinate-nucleotide--dimethylbenzimidazole phosphoribosyltransferase